MRDQQQEDREHSIKDHENEERERIPVRDDRGRERDDRLRERDDRERRIVNREREDRERPALARDHDERPREKDDRERREKDKERDDRHNRDRREEDRHLDKKDYDKDRYRDERDRHRPEDKPRPREKDRHDRYEPDKDRHDRYDRRSSADRKKSRKSPTPYSQKTHPNPKESTPDRTAKKKEKDHEEKPDEKRKEKKLKEKKKKKDDEKEKKKKKKKEKKSVSKEAGKDETVKPSAETIEANPDDEKSEPIGSPKKPESKPIAAEDENLTQQQITSEALILPDASQSGFEDKSLAMNPEPPEFPEASPETAERAFGTNPPNPNFKPIPELKSDAKPIESLYSGLEDAEINTVITEKYALITGEIAAPLDGGEKRPGDEKSPLAIGKKDEFLAPIPELSKWERDEAPEKIADEESSIGSGDRLELDEPKTSKIVTSEVLKRAENAIFQKAINAIRPIEIKKISESRKVLYQNPEPKIIEVDAAAGSRKGVNVTINVGRNERNVEITEASVKKAKLDRTKFKPVPETFSPTRLSAKERLGEKIEDASKERKLSPMKSFMDRREGKGEARNRSPRREKRAATPSRGVASGEAGGAERKVFLEERKRDGKERNKERNDFRGERHEFRSSRGGNNDPKDRRTPNLGAGQLKRGGVAKAGGRDEEEEERRREKKPREEKKRKKEHHRRSRSKSREHKKQRKEKKHKREKERNTERKQRHKEAVGVAKEKAAAAVGVEGRTIDATSSASIEGTAGKKLRKNPRLVSDRKRSILDEASFEPDYSASDSETETEEGGKLGPLPAKKLKLEEGGVAATTATATATATVAKEEIEMKQAKKRQKSSSSDDSTSSDDTSTTDSESSDSESHRKKRRKHRKHKKRKSIKKETSSDTYSDSETSESSSDEEKHKKKKKSKSRSSKAKKKKKSKHK